MGTPRNKLFSFYFLCSMMLTTTACNSTFSTSLSSVAENDSASTTPDPQPGTPPATPDPVLEVREVTPLWEKQVPGSSTWTAHVDSELVKLGSDLLDVIPADTALFCPNYSHLSLFQRKQYWAYLISAMVRFESSFKTETSYTEGFNDSAGRPVVSRGLLQISIESGNAYGCAFKTTNDLHDPLQNLSCGIRILNRWVGRDGQIAGKVDNAWRGGARYWSVLRTGDKTSYNSIVSWSQNLPFCK